MSLGDIITEFSKRVLSSAMPTPTICHFPPAPILPPDAFGKQVPRDGAYFSVKVNELFLTSGRRFWAEYDPLIYVAVDFLYNSNRTIIPTLLGPRTLKTEKVDVPHGFLINDVNVVGPHPFRGGRIGITAILYRAKHKDYATRMLGIAERLSSTIGVPADIGILAKVGQSLIESVETLMDMGDLEPITGHRIEIDTATTKGFRTFATALVGPGLKSEPRLRLVEGRLYEGDVPFRESDYFLYSVAGYELRADASSLPFHAWLGKAINQAVIGDEPSWKRAKAILLTMYQEMLSSPDLTDAEADLLFNQYKERIITAREHAKSVSMMSPERARRAHRFVEKLDDATELVDSL